jgi:hypothetical protein
MRHNGVPNKVTRDGKTEHYNAIGLGQLSDANLKYQPMGRLGVGDAYNEVIGMLRYIQKDPREGGVPYGDPCTAWNYKRTKFNNTY